MKLSQLELFECSGSDEPVLFRANRVTLNSDKFLCVQDSETVQVVALGSSASDGMSKAPQRSFSTSGKRRTSVSPDRSLRATGEETQSGEESSAIATSLKAVEKSTTVDEGPDGRLAVQRRKGETEAFSLGYRIYGRWPIIGGVSVIAHLCDPHVHQEREEQRGNEAAQKPSTTSLQPLEGKRETKATGGGVRESVAKDSHRYSCAGHGYGLGQGQGSEAGKEERWHCVVAVKQGMRIEIFDAKVDKKIRQCVALEPIQLWKFIGDGLIALVGTRAVYHWKFLEDAEPQQLFEICKSMASLRMLDYRMDESHRFSVLCGVGVPHPGVPIAGRLQVYSTKLKVSMELPGFCADFLPFLPYQFRRSCSVVAAELRDSYADTASSTERELALCHINYNQSTCILSLHCQPVRALFGAGPSSTASMPSRKGSVGRKDQLGCPTKCYEYRWNAKRASDMPLYLNCFSDLGLVYLTTKKGYLCIFHVDTGSCVLDQRISEHALFAVAKLKHSSGIKGGIMGVNKKGQLILASIDREKLIPYVTLRLKNVRLAVSLLTYDATLPGPSKPFAHEFVRHLKANRYQDAAELVVFSPKAVMRRQAVVERFMAAPYETGKPAPLQYLLGALLQFAEQLTEFETVVLIKETIKVGTSVEAMIGRWMKLGKLACTELVASILAERNFSALATAVRAVMSTRVAVEPPPNEGHGSDSDGDEDDEEAEQEHEPSSRGALLELESVASQQDSPAESLAHSLHEGHPLGTAQDGHSLVVGLDRPDTNLREGDSCTEQCGGAVKSPPQVAEEWKSNSSAVSSAIQSLPDCTATGTGEESWSEEETEETQRVQEYLLGSSRMSAKDSHLDDDGDGDDGDVGAGFGL